MKFLSQFLTDRKFKNKNTSSWDSVSKNLIVKSLNHLYEKYEWNKSTTYIEHMTQMRVAALTSNFSARHTVAFVRNTLNIVTLILTTSGLIIFIKTTKKVAFKYKWQGYPQKIRLQRRLYGIYTVCFLKFMTSCNFFLSLANH